MSYSLNHPCNECLKNDKCADRHMIQAAIYAIHAVPYATCHLGYGSIDLKCSGIEKKQNIG